MDRSELSPKALARRAGVATIVVLAVLTTVTLVAPVAPAGATAPYCGITWGSRGRADSRMTAAPVVGLRAGRHACFDRLVVDVRSRPVAGWYVRYVPQVVQDASGFPVPLRGGAFLQVSIHAPAYDDDGHATYSPARPREAVNVAGFRTFRQVAFAGSFEGITTVGLGVRARLPFRVFAVPGPGSRIRIVIDVAHRWT